MLNRTVQKQSPAATHCNAWQQLTEMTVPWQKKKAINLGGAAYIRIWRG